MHHYVDVGDAQRGGEELAVCSCGWRDEVPHRDELTTRERHAELMALSWGHVYANAWRLVDNDDTDE